MTLMLTERGRNMVLGALVADAASMGLHWIYDQDHIRKLAPEAPEFVGPDPKHYANVAGYFAHSALKTGDQTQYGTQLTVLLGSLQTTGGDYDASVYTRDFLEHFGYGGKYVGYIDRATRESLNNHVRSQDDALRLALELPYDGKEKTTLAMVTKAMSLIGQLSGDALREAFDETILITHPDDDAARAHGFEVLDVILAAPPASGAFDVQLPAISKLPALVAAFEATGRLEDAATMDAIDSAVRVTNDHPQALAYGRVVVAMMATALRTDTIETAINAGRAKATPEIAALLDDALSRHDSSTNETTKHFGMACDLDYGVPSAVHNVTTATSYREAIRRNIYAGGDSSGRAILVGALMGALHGIGGSRGIPPEWIEKLTSNPV